MPISIFVVEPHQLVRAGIQLGCQNEADFMFVGDAATVDHAIDDPPATSPDVLVINPAALDGCDDPQFVAWLAAHPDCRVLAMASDANAVEAAHWIHRGVTGYISNDSPIETLTLAIRLVHQGRVFISHPQHAAVVPRAHCKSNATASAVNNGVDVDLSDRERQVLAMIADGMTNKQAASRLFLSVKTVETYRSRVMRKHNLRDRKDLVRFASELA